MTTALALAFAAGMVATLNPCGFAMLPAYLSYFIGIDSDENTKPASVRTGLVVGSIVSLGFLTVFGIAGIVITAGFRSVIAWIPWLAVVVGVVVVILGIALLSGWQMTVTLPKVGRRGAGRGFRGIFGFGVSYAVASLSCTLPVFLSVVATQITTRSFLAGMVVFVAYGLGMSVVLLGITVVLALGKSSLVQRLRHSGGSINRVAGGLLVLAGLFIVWFWTTEIVAGATALNDSAVFRLVERLSQTAINFVAANTLMVAVTLLGTITAAVLYTWWMRPRPDDVTPNKQPPSRVGAPNSPDGR